MPSFLILSSIFLISCTSSLSVKEAPLMGTFLSVDLRFKKFMNKSEKEMVRNDLIKIVRDLEKEFSLFDEQSTLSAINKSSKYPLSDDWMAIFKIAQDLSQMSHGLYDISVAPLVNLWGFGVKQRYRVPLSREIRQVQKYVGMSNYTIKKNILYKRKKTQFDLGSIAKGFAVDKLKNYLVKIAKKFTINLGGELYIYPQDKVAIEAPFPSVRTVFTIINVSDMAVATSGNYRNFFTQDHKKFTHIINPQTGEAVQSSLLSATVLHKSAAWADALATTMLLLGNDALSFANKHNLAVYLIYLKADQNIDQLQVVDPKLFIVQASDAWQALIP